jgi:KaiC domain protein
MPEEVERLSLGVPGLDAMLQGGVPRGFFVAVTGEPGTGKTILSIHFMNQGLKEGDRCIFVTTEESRASVVRQAAQFSMDFKAAIEQGKMIIVDALMGQEERWSLNSLDVEQLVDKVVEAKRELGYGRARLVIDSVSAFWLDRPAMARRYSYFLKKVLAKWDFTILATSQYAITSAESFGWGIEHIADGIIRFRRAVRQGELKRYVLIEKMRQTNHDRYLHEVAIEPGVGLLILERVSQRKEDIALPAQVTKRIAEAGKAAEEAIP